MKTTLLSVLFFVATSGMSFAVEEAEESAVKTPPVRVEASDTERLIELAGSEAVVKGVVLSVNTTEPGNITFLNFGTEKKKDFVVVLFPKHREAFEGMDLKNDFAGRTVEVSGVLEIYKVQPQIKITSPAQLKVVAEETPTKPAE